MAEDPYKVLGVARDASDDEIRRVYRKLAKELHPDVNPSNRSSAEERFKRVSAAYDIVGDAEKRKKYDRGEINAEGHESPRGFSGGFGAGGVGFCSLFASAFGRTGGVGAIVSAFSG